MEPRKVPYPTSKIEWITQAKIQRQCKDPMKLNLLGQQYLGSASKLSLREWILFRVIVKEHTHTGQDGRTEFVLYKDIFGDEEAGLKARHKALDYLRTTPWWKHFDKEVKTAMKKKEKRHQRMSTNSQNTSMLRYNYMRPWRSTLSEILVRQRVKKDRHESDMVDNQEEKSEEETQENVDELEEKYEQIVESDPKELPATPLVILPTFPEAVSDSSRVQPTVPTIAESLSSDATPQPRYSASIARSLSSDVMPDVPSRSPDEDVVNKCFIELLEGILFGLQDNKEQKFQRFKWSNFHRTFQTHVPLRRGSSEQVCVILAKPDGCLQRLEDGKLLEECATEIMVEVKNERRRRQLQLRIQESGEVICWICEESEAGLLPSVKKGVFRRVMLTQNLDHVSVIIAEYDEEYVQYVRGEKTPGGKRKPGGTGGFLVMNEYGSFRLSKPMELKALIIMLTALMDHICTQSFEKEEKKKEESRREEEERQKKEEEEKKETKKQEKKERKKERRSQRMRV